MSTAVAWPSLLISIGARAALVASIRAKEASRSSLWPFEALDEHL
jgi:hypothetical protein